MRLRAFLLLQEWKRSSPARVNLKTGASPGGVTVRWKIAATLLAVPLLFTAAVAQEITIPVPAPTGAALPAIEPPGRASVGVALEGGGALGLAHIGVLQWFEEHHIPVDRISGTSMGALIGALYATGDTPAQIRALAVSDAFTRVFALQSSYSDLSFRRRQDRRELPEALTVGLRHRLALPNALLTDRGVNEFLTTNLLRLQQRRTRLQSASHPFSLRSHRPEHPGTGHFLRRAAAHGRARLHLHSRRLSLRFRIATATISSTAASSTTCPPMFSSANCTPTSSSPSALRMRALSNSTPAPSSACSTAPSTPASSATSRSPLLLADVVVSVPVGSFSGTDYSTCGALIEAGYKAAEQKRARCLPYALDDEGWKAYLAAREGRRAAAARLPAPGSRGRRRAGRSSARFSHDLKPIEGQPITPAATLDALKPVQSNGGVAATWETFSANFRTPSAAGPRLARCPTRVCWSTSATTPPARPICSSVPSWPPLPPTSAAAN